MSYSLTSPRQQTRSDASGAMLRSSRLLRRSVHAAATIRARASLWPRLGRLLLLLWTLQLVDAEALSAQQPWSHSGVARVVAVGDVHGAHDELVSLLQATGVIDRSLAWSGGTSHLVSLGDLLDRGPGSRAVLDLLMRLQREAAEDGGAVHVILGNHEMMNLLGDLRYLTAADYAAYAVDESQAVRDSAFTSFQSRQPAASPRGDARAAFDARFPPGYFARRRAFEPDGKYGEWLLSLPALLRVNDVAYVHGGLSELVAQSSPEAVNQRVREQLLRHFALREQLVQAGLLSRWQMGDERDLARERLRAKAGDSTAAGRSLSALLNEFIELPSAPELGVDGPLWYRGAPFCNAFIEQSVVDAALARLGAERVVIGHTVSPDRLVRTLFDGRVLMLDTGMLASYYDGRPSALILTAAGDVVRYLDPEEENAPATGRIEAYDITEAELLLALSQGRILPDTTSVANGGWQRVLIHHAGRQVAAIFRPRDPTREADRELAAYSLDAMLGLGLVPPTVTRVVGGREGALQLHYDDAVTETTRLRDNAALGEWCALEPQAALARAFDYLIAKTRLSDDVLYRVTFPTVKLINHARAFGTGSPASVPVGLIPSPALREALSRIDHGRLDAALGEWLEPGQIAAILVRRDQLLEAPLLAGRR